MQKTVKQIAEEFEKITGLTGYKSNSKYWEYYNDIHGFYNNKYIHVNFSQHPTQKTEVVIEYTTEDVNQVEKILCSIEPNLKNLTTDKQKKMEKISDYLKIGFSIVDSETIGVKSNNGTDQILTLERVDSVGYGIELEIETNVLLGDQIVKDAETFYYTAPGEETIEQDIKHFNTFMTLSEEFILV